MYGESFISKVIDTGDYHAFDRFGITLDILPTVGERQAVEFIQKYAAENAGEVPSYHTVAAEVESFTYIPDVSDSFKFLADEIKEYAARKRINDLWVGEKTAKDFKSMSSEEFIEHMQKELDEIRSATAKNRSIGFDLKKDNEKYQSEYQRRKEGKSFKIWKSRFATINEATGGYLSGNVYAWFGRSGRGKSVFVTAEGIESAFQGATVLIWSLEMGWYELASRLLTVVSTYTDIMDTLGTGFETKAALMGMMEAGLEAEFFAFLKRLNEIIPGNIIIRGVDDPDFTNRNCRQLQVDIKQVEADVVIIDPIYYMQMEENTSKTSGGDVANTSKKLRHIAGVTGVVMHVVTQAEEINDDEDAEGNRELRVPKRIEVKKAKQILEDATNLYGIDTCDGRGMIVIGKGRNGGEDIRCEIQYMPQVGIIREIKPAAEGLSQFEKLF